VLSIVSTMYRSGGHLPVFIDECAAAAEHQAPGRWELVLVNDGSPDDSLAIALSRRDADPRITVVDLSRNFGHHPAMHAGLVHARGEWVFLIDCDLEVRPAVLSAFFTKLSASGADLVYGYQEHRKGDWFERVSGRWFWRGINAISDVPVPENMLTERLMTRRFVNALLSLGDQDLFLGGMMSWTGFIQLGMPVEKRQRIGDSSYTLGRRMRLMLTAVSSFSTRPLTWLFNLGCATTLASFGYGAYLLFRRLAFNDTLVGFTSIMGLMTLGLGLLFMGLGLVGIYLGKVLEQVRGRPRYIVRDVHR
jgi:putative glycosyltransferase